MDRGVDRGRWHGRRGIVAVLLVGAIFAIVLGGVLSLHRGRDPAPSPPGRLEGRPVPPPEAPALLGSARDLPGVAPAPPTDGLEAPSAAGRGPRGERSDSAEEVAAGPPLLVVDGRTGEAVQGARVYRRADSASPGRHLTERYPDGATLAGRPSVTDRDGLAPTRDDDDRWWVIADGFAWQPVLRSQLSPEGRTQVPLTVQGGALAIQALGWQPREGLHLFAVQGEDTDRLPEPDEAGTLLLEGVRPGSYRILAKEGHSFWTSEGEARTAGQAEVRVAAGERARAVLDLQTTDRHRVRARVAVESGPAWGEAPVRVTWGGIDPTTERVQISLDAPRAPTGPFWATEAVELPVGRYELGVTLSEMDYTRILRLDAAGTVEVRVTDPATVRVEANAAKIGPATAVLEAHWSVTDADGGVFRGRQVVPASSGVASFQVPAGVLEVHLASEDAAYLEERRTVGAVRGGATVDVRFSVRLAGKIDLLLFDGAEPIDGKVVWVAVVPVDGQPEPGSFRDVVTDGRIAIGPLVPGRYFVRLTVDGYTTAESDRIDVRGGASSEVRVRLRRP